MLAEPQWALIFGAAKKRGARWSDLADVNAFKREVETALAGAPPEHRPSGRTVSQQGIDLIHSFEQCKLEAYPDPGSKDGTPWTIGWGSTGPDIKRGTVWTQEQADERFARDISSFAAKVDALVGDAPTKQNQFDAMCSLAYNIGTNGFAKSTVLRKHKAGDYLGAARAFLMWNKNDGKVMRGLTRRRLAESDLYDN